MRKSWKTSLAAAVCAVGMIVEAAQGSPVGMTMPSGQSAQSAPVRVAAAPRTTTVAAAPASTATHSKNPFAYVSRAVSSSPVLSAFRSEKRPAPTSSVTPAKNDPISLSTPAGPPSPQLVISSAQMCEQRGDINQARQIYQRALATWPCNAEVLRAAARMEDRVGQLPLAENLYQQVVAANPQNAGALNDLGLCLARQGKLDQSLQALEQAVRLDPGKALYRNNAATVCIEMRQDQRAMAHLSAVHGPAEVQYNMGQLLVARNRAAEAEHYFKAAFEAKPELLNDPSLAISQLPGRQQVPSSPAQIPAGPAAIAPTTATNETFAPANVPATSPEVAPQAGPQFGPQMSYPTDYGQSTYAPPTYQPPFGPMTTAPSVSLNPQPSVPWVSQAPPRSLPPVSAGGAVQGGTRR